MARAMTKTGRPGRLDQGPGAPGLAERMGLLGTETAFEVLVRARELERQGRDVVHLEIGEPDFDTPAHVKEAAKQALDEGWTHYGPAAGLPELREAIADHVARTRGIAVDPAQVVVTPGAKPVLFFSLLALVQPGDEVIFPDPGFPIYESMIRFAGATPVPLTLREERAFAFDPAELPALFSRRTRLVILNSPHNPTGGVLDRPALEAVAAAAQARDVVVLADEIYSSILYGGEHVSIASLPGMAERTILLDGFSKTYAMTGWRLGYGVFPRPLVAAIERLAVNSVSCTASFVQRAGLAALGGSQAPVADMVAELQRRRTLVVDGLNAIPGIRCLEPQGAFYAFPNVRKLGLSSDELADRLLQEAGVATLAGTAFGSAGEGYLRLSYANSIANLQEALRRLAAAARQYRA